MYERLVERLRTHVLQADLRAGDRLPPERELAARLGVSRSSVRQAIVALQVRGLVEVRHGGGTFLRGDDLDPAPSARILDLQRRLPDILDAREALAVKLAELAAERRTDADLQAIHAALAVMADQVEQSTPGEAGDEAFQHCITAAAHSSVLAQMSADLAQDIGASRHESPSHAGRPPASLAQHRAVADAVRDGDAAAAADAMRVHLRSVRDDRLPSGQAPPALLPDKELTNLAGSRASPKPARVVDRGPTHRWPGHPRDTPVSPTHLPRGRLTPAAGTPRSLDIVPSG